MKIKSYPQRLRWFHQARFGMFIHWGLDSLLKRGEWVMFRERIRPADYAKLADQFRPTKFDADAWAGLAAETAGRFTGVTFAMYATGNDQRSGGAADFDWFDHDPAPVPPTQVVK